MTTTPTFRQPTKAAAREASLKHAVELLTSRRSAAAIVPEKYVSKVRDELLKSDTHGYARAGRLCSDHDIESWQRFQVQSIGTREPRELTVAYFAGPEPSNDLQALLNLGLLPENIWAFESDASAISRGLSDLERLRLRGIKFTPTQFSQYIIGTPRRFDIIYVDACAPLPSNGQGTTRIISDIFRFSALSPLGVLITNFAKPDLSEDRDKKNFSHLIASYLYPKSFMESAKGRMIDGPIPQNFFMPSDVLEEDDADSEDFPFDKDKCFVDEVANNFEQHYGAFITRHLMDIASIVAPTTRLIDSGLWKILFSEKPIEAAKRAHRFVKPNPLFFSKDFNIEEAEDVEMDGEAGNEASFYSLLRTLSECEAYGIGQRLSLLDAETQKFERRWIDQLVGSQSIKLQPENVIAAFYAWRHDRSFWSDAMRRISNFPFQRKMPLLCDVPTDEIGFYPAFAQLAYPAHANVREAKRFRYVAEGKTTEMFTDVLVFDECRYVYDWLSAPHLINGDWDNVSTQLTFRFALDAIAKNCFRFSDDFLYGCHAVPISAEFPEGDMAPRKNLMIHRLGKKR
ncbi:hypothetical protein [Azospirillum argentinense]